MLEEERAQFRHEALAFVEFDQIGSDEGCARVGVWTGPGAVGGTLGEALPRQVAEERAILLDDGVVRDPGWERGGGLFERAGRLGVDRRTRRLAPEGSAEALERGEKIE
jgi:hypothetical protein